MLGPINFCSHITAEFNAVCLGVNLLRGFLEMAQTSEASEMLQCPLLAVEFEG
jgi:hypothetical protein